MSQAQLKLLLKPFIKPAVLLKLSPSESAIPASCESKFGGLPYAEKDDTWASCPACENELLFVAQIKHPQEKSLLTFFYCFECSPWGFGEEEKGQWLLQHYPNPDMKNYVELKPTQPQPYSLTSCSCTEHTIQTLPSFETLQTLSPEAAALCGEDDAYEVYDEAVGHCDCQVDYASFIGGYPKWIQSEAVKTCPLCEAEMEFFAQLDSEDSANVMWGDCGAVYFFRCPKHQSTFDFELQCY